MKPLLMLSCAICALGIHSAQAETGTDPALQKMAACKKLQDPEAYKALKLDTFKTVLAGKDGWIFRTRPDFTTDFSFDAPSIAKIQKIQKLLAEKNVTLYIAYLPNRGIMASAYLPDNSEVAAAYDVEQAKTSYKNLVKNLQDADLNIITLDHDVPAEKFFRKTDQHWSTNGAREFAKTVASVLKKDKSYGDIPKMDFETTSKGPYALSGRFGQATKKLCGITLAQEQDELTLTAPKMKDSGEAGLFGDTAKPSIALIGTSFSRSDQYDTNFLGFLKEYTQADIYDATISGGGIDDPLIAYLSSEDFKISPPKMIVWEIPGHYVLAKKDARFLDEIVPSALGECSNPVADFKNMAIDGKTIDLFKNIASKDVQGDGYYIHLKFDKPVDKKIELLFHYEGNIDASYSFKRNARYPFDGLFHIQLPYKKDKDDTLLTLASVELSPDKKLENVTVSGQLCPLPSDLITDIHEGTTNSKSSKNISFMQKIKSYFSKGQ